MAILRLFCIVRAGICAKPYYFEPAFWGLQEKNATGGNSSFCNFILKENKKVLDKTMGRTQLRRRIKITSFAKED